MYDNIKNAIVSLAQSKTILNSYQVTNIISLGGLDLISYDITPALVTNSNTPSFIKDEWALPGQTNIPIAAAITAYSRIIMNQFKLDV